VLGDRERHALLGLERKGALAELGAQASVGAEHGGGARQDAEEVRELGAAREGALQDREASLRGRELVVDVEPALLRLLRHGLTSLWVAYVL
jgi:hypothetical protein